MFSALLIPFFELARTGGYWAHVNDWLDNKDYVEIANVIRVGGIPVGSHFTHFFWGLPGMIAVTQVAFGISGFAALVGISVASSVAACFLIHRLYGGVVTVTFLILSPEWVRLSVIGGSEPLFLCLLLGSWLAFRSSRALMASVFASLATTVRPVGVFALCAFAFALILQRDWRRLVMSICIAAGIGLAYLEWVQMVTGDPFINFRLYSPDWPSGNPLSLPFVTLGKSAYHLLLDRRWVGWMYALFSLPLVGFGVFFLLKQRQILLRTYPAEIAFVIAYLSFLACYNYGGVMNYFLRFEIPVIPFLLFAARKWLPKSRLVLWPLAVSSALITSSLGSRL
jgi:hypothetical protein